METDKILIVDDDKDIRDIVEVYLQNNGFETVKAESGKRALEILETAKIKLAIIDVMMPEMDGIKLCMIILPLSLRS